MLTCFSKTFGLDRYPIRIHLFILALIVAQSSGMLEPIQLPGSGFKIDDSEAFILAKRNVRSVIIINHSQPKYRFPYFGAHKILQRYLKMITGQTVPIVTDQQVSIDNLNRDYDFRIWMGHQPRVLKLLRSELDKIDDDGLIIRTNGRDLLICGKYDWGTHFAVYELLERFAGCRWYLWEPRFWKPEEDGLKGLGDIIPSASSVKIPADTSIIKEPSYKMRWMRHLPRHSFKMRYRDKFHHALVTYLHPKKYGKSHPEYFPLINGKRYIPDVSRAYDFQPCVSNPDVVKVVTEEVLNYFKMNPDETSASLGMNDSNKYCQCEQCDSVVPDSIKGSSQRIAYKFFNFYNKIALEIEKEFPKKRLGVLAYGSLTNLPPGSIKLHKNLVPYVTRDSAQLFDLREQKEFKNVFSRWDTLSEQLGIYEYFYGNGYIIPRFYNRYLNKNIKSRYDTNVDGFYAEDYPNWGLDGHKYWLAAKLLWDNQADPQELLDEYYQNMFGPCSGIMKNYFECLEDIWCSQTLMSDTSNFRWFKDKRQLEIFPPEKCDKAWSFLKEAEQLIQQYSSVVESRHEQRYCQNILDRIDYFKSTFALTRHMSYRCYWSKELERLAVNKRVDVIETMKYLEKVLDTRMLERDYQRVKDLKNALYSVPEELVSFRQQWENTDGPGNAMRDVVDAFVQKSIEDGRGDPAVIKKRIDRMLQELIKIDEFEFPRAYNLIREVGLESGFFFVRSAVSVPTIDGIIEQNEWGKAVYDGYFHKPFSLTERTDTKTTIWAKEDGQKIYLAFLCEGIPSLVGGKIQGRNTDVSPYPKMAKDDSISITFLPSSGAYGVIAFNAEGALRDKSLKGLPVTAFSVKKDSSYWQAELAIDLDKSYINKQSVLKKPVRICISRYTRQREQDNGDTMSIKTVCSTITPVFKRGDIIGHGNHPATMVFVDGPFIVYENMN